MDRCFVIQPFDRGKYDKRYEDTFEPAIVAAGLEPYRVDRDPSSQVPIEDIEAGIRAAVICVAEISTPNPNVWFELGYAFAAGKTVVMLCEDGIRLPFDIQHRTVIQYETDAASDYETLRTTITERLVAGIQRQEELAAVTEVNPLSDTEGLSPHEMASLIVVAQSTGHASDSLSLFELKDAMRSAGYTDIAVTMGIRGLDRKQMVEAFMDHDYNDNEFPAYRVTERGLAWLESNIERLVLRRAEQDSSVTARQATLDVDDIPF